MRKDETRTYVGMPGGFAAVASSTKPTRVTSGDPTGTGKTARSTAGGAEMDTDSWAGDELGDAAESPGQQV